MKEMPIYTFDKTNIRYINKADLSVTKKNRTGRDEYCCIHIRKRGTIHFVYDLVFFFMGTKMAIIEIYLFYSINWYTQHKN